MIVLDLETQRFGPGCKAPAPVCAQVLDDRGARILHLGDGGGNAELARVLNRAADDKTPVIGHHICYDLAVLLQWRPEAGPIIWRLYDAGLVVDTKIVCKLADIARGNGVDRHYTLAACVERELGEKVDGKADPDGWRLRFGELSTVPLAQWPAEAVDYALADVRWPRALIGKLGMGQATLADQCRAGWALHLAHCWGLRVDAPRALRRKAELRATVQDAARELNVAGLMRGDSKVQKAIETMVLSELGDACPKTPTGRPSTDADTLAMLKAPAAKLLRRSQSSRTLLDTFVPVLERGVDGAPIHPDWNVLVASGRTSCRDPNFQNLPRDGGIRECFVPREGWVYIAADYSIAELVCLAEVCISLFGSSKMGDLLRSGMDLHVATAARMFLRCEYADAKVRKDAGDAGVKGAREGAKALNFGIPGGMMEDTLAAHLADYGVTVTRREAKVLREEWLNFYPEVGRLFSLVRSRTGRGDARTSFEHVHPTTGFVRGRVGYRDGCNQYFQHLCGAIAKSALYEISRRCYGAGDRPTALTGCRLVGFVHDEFVCEAPAPVASEAADELAAVMVETAGRWLRHVPIRAEAKVMARWSKKADGKRGPDGRLLVWDDNA